MSSKIDTPLDNLVKSNRVKNKGRGVGRAQKMVNSSRQNRAGRGRGRGIASKFTGGVRGGSTNITARLGFTTKLKSTQNGVKTKNVQKVSDLRDVLATKTKTTVADLRAKLPQKPPVKNEKKKIPAPPAPRSRSPLRISSDMFRSSTRPRGGGSSHSKEAIFSKSSREAERTLSRRLPTTAEAKKITVTVQGLSKTTSEVRSNKNPGRAYHPSWSCQGDISYMNKSFKNNSATLVLCCIGSLLHIAGLRYAFVLFCIVIMFVYFRYTKSQAFMYY